nr:hypothetical protein [Tanacetum cinerariifolium]
MATLADKAILSGADNRPPMLEKELYNSWKSVMELYMMNRQHGRMIIESVKNGPLIWPTTRENEVTRPRKYSELTPAEALQADCDEEECKLYDEFDKFAYKKGETLCDFYLRFSLLLNDFSIYNVKLKQFQVNTKFLNSLPPKWSKFVTDVKIVQGLHTTNIDHLHAYLEQHEFYANESPQYGSPYQSHHYSTTQSSTPLLITYPSNDYQSSVHHNVYSPQPSIPQFEYVPTVNQQQKQHEFSPLDLDLNVPVFKREGHISKQCTKPKRKRDDSLFKDKVLLIQAQANGQILHEGELAFLADPGIPKVSLMANLSHYGSHALAEVYNPDNVDNHMINHAVQDNYVSNQSALSFDHYFELNELKAQSQEKDTVISKLKERIKSLSGNKNMDKVKQDIEEIETINIELDHRVSKLIAKNKHLQQTYKQLYDSIKSTRVRSKEQCDALTNQVHQKSVEIFNLNVSLQEQDLVITALQNDLRKLKGKALVDNAVKSHTIDPEMLKIDVEPLAPKLLNNRTVHSDYLRHTQEQAAILREVVEQGK